MVVLAFIAIISLKRKIIDRQLLEQPKLILLNSLFKNKK